jgi:sugar lactone lactonase YvrE
VKKACGGAVNAFASMWVASCADGTLLRLDARTLKPKATITTGAVDIRGAIAASPDSIWLIADNKQTIVRIDPDQNAVVAELRIPSGCSNMIFAETSLWVACAEQNKILRINPVTNLIDKRIDVAAKPVALASGQGSIWVLCGKEGKLDRIDPKTDKVAKTIELSVPDSAGAMAYGEGYLWVTMTGFPLTRIDISEADKERVAQQFWGDGGGAILTSSGALWLSNLNNGTISRIDPKLVLATLAE